MSTLQATSTHSALGLSDEQLRLVDEVRDFADTVVATHPMYVVRALGGVLFLAGGVIMVFNLWKTAVGSGQTTGATTVAAE